MNPQHLLSWLLEQGLLDPAQDQLPPDESNHSAVLVEQWLRQSGISTQDQLLAFIANQLGLYRIDFTQTPFEPNPELQDILPPPMAQRYAALPLAATPRTLTVVPQDPLDTQNLDALRWALGRDLHVVIAAPEQVEFLLSQYAGNSAHLTTGDAPALSTAIRHISESPPVAANDTNSTPVIRLVDSIIAKAVRAQASDIHFEPFEREFRIRYRVDGALYEMAPPPLRLLQPIISRLKVMAGLDIAERRVPQDGRIQTSMDQRPVDLRVSSLPTRHGESVVLRVLDRNVVRLDLAQLGMPLELLQQIRESIHRPHGIFIVTGPTGSGKTTTLYSCLNQINDGEIKILTAEDPVEYQLAGIQQVSVHEGIGLSFARILRAFLRQDPDCLLVGEIRDAETAQIAVQAALTGHLVFTSLHTNDAPDAITRLIDLAVAPFLLSATLLGVLGQRLVRRICPRCRTAYTPDRHQLAQAGLAAGAGDKPHFYRGTGCQHCHWTGYNGRLGIYEWLAIQEPLRQLIHAGASSRIIRQQAIEDGMATLRQQALRHVLDGTTTLAELLKHT